MILYIVGGFIVFLLCIIAFIKIKYPFWSIQPVFHYYDFYYWFVDSGIINKKLPEKNKYFHPQIKIFSYEQITEIHQIDFLKLIQTNYIHNKEYKNNKFLPLLENIVPYFTSHNSPCYWSLYYKPKVTTDLSEEKVLISAITSRPLHVYIEDKIQMDVYYIDYLCVDVDNRKKGVAPQMIQTHEYSQRHQNHDIQVCLFKREDELTGIIPITAYDTYGFKNTKWYKPQDLPAQITILKADSQNLYYLVDFIRLNKSVFKINIMPEISNLLELIKTNNLIIYIIMEEGKIHGAYFFRKNCTYVEEKEAVFSCIASINVSAEEKVFIHGFKVAIFKIMTEYPECKYVLLEKISHNHVIIKDLCKKTHPIISKTAYFFYNFAYHTFESDKVFILN